MRIEVLYFGVLKDLFGCRQATVELPKDSDVSSLLALLKRPESVFSSLAVAVNREYASLTTILSDGDEVALLPPVSGGSSTSMDPHAH